MSVKELFIQFTARTFRQVLSVYLFSYFPFGFESRIWDLIVSVPDHCLSFYFKETHKLIHRGPSQRYSIRPQPTYGSFMKRS